MKNKKSFTLIELLVVIAIIGLLSTVVLVSVGNVRAKARDAKRQADITEMAKALEMYFVNNDQYPSEGCFDGSIGGDWCGTCGACGTAPGSCTASDWCANSPIYTKLVTENKFMGKLPIDPSNNTTYYYQYEPDCNQPGAYDCTGKGCCAFLLRGRLEGGGWFRKDGTSGL